MTSLRLCDCYTRRFERYRTYAIRRQCYYVPLTNLDNLQPRASQVMQLRFRNRRHAATLLDVNHDNLLYTSLFEPHTIASHLTAIVSRLGNDYAIHRVLTQVIKRWSATLPLACG